MCATWRKDPTLALSKLKGLYKLNEKGEVEYTSYLYDDCVEVLLAALDYRSTIPEDTVRGFLRRSLAEALKKKPVSHDLIVRAVSRMETEYIALPLKPFTLFGSISITSQRHISQIDYRGHTIFFGKDVPPDVSKREPEFKRIFLQAEQREFPPRYLRYAISTIGRSDSEAGNVALDVMDYHRALWNLPLNSSLGWRHSTRREPINKIMLGPLHVLFTEDFGLVEDKWWHELGQSHPVKPYDISNIWNRLKSFERRVFKKLNSSSLRQFFLKALVRYVRALDGQDYESVYLKLWSLLEYLTQTGHEKYDVTIRRASFLWKDHAFHRQVLNVLRDARNVAVHLDQFSGSRGEAYIYQLKRYVEDLLIFLLSNCEKFKSLDEVKDLLDLPPDSDLLIRKQRLTKWGIKLRSPTQSKIG
jgi:hypothetical protein